MSSNEPSHTQPLVHPSRPGDDGPPSGNSGRFKQRPKLCSLTQLAGISICIIALFACTYFYRDLLGSHSRVGKAVAMTFHGGKGKVLGSHSRVGKALAITFHGGKGKVSDVEIFPLAQLKERKFVGNGIQKGLFGQMQASRVSVHELRGMILFPDVHTNKDSPLSLLTLNGYQGDSKILSYNNPCLARQGTLEVWREMTECLHPYAIRILDEQAYVTCQTSNEVLRYKVDRPDLGGEVVFTVEEPRAIAASKKRHWLYVAERWSKRVLVFDTVSNQSIGSMAVEKPIGVVLDAFEQKVYVGSRKTGHVVIFDAVTFVPQGSFSHERMVHPAGMVIDDGYLYVICQRNRHVIAFDLETAEPHFVIKQLTPHRAEDIVVLPCIPE